MFECCQRTSYRHPGRIAFRVSDLDTRQITLEIDAAVGYFREYARSALGVMDSGYPRAFEALRHAKDRRQTGT
jgi:hypothetical protein